MPDQCDNGITECPDAGMRLNVRSLLTAAHENSAKLDVVSNQVTVLNTSLSGMRDLALQNRLQLMGADLKSGVVGDVTVMEGRISRLDTDVRTAVRKIEGMETRLLQILLSVCAVAVLMVVGFVWQRATEMSPTPALHGSVRP